MKAVTVLLPIAVLVAGLTACNEGDISGEAGRVAEDARERVEQRIEDESAEVTDSEVRKAARDACEAVPVDELAQNLGTDASDVQSLAESFAESFPEDVREEVRTGCLEGLDA